MANIQFFFQKGIDVVDIESSFQVRITSVRGLLPSQPKDIFTRDWASEDGVDYYLPAQRKIKAGEVVITGFAEGMSPASPSARIAQICSYVLSEPVMYWDTLQKRKATLIYNANKPIWEHYVVGNEKTMFELTFLNPSGEVSDVVV